jgi:hypothetical protein
MVPVSAKFPELLNAWLALKMTGSPIVWDVLKLPVIELVIPATNVIELPVMVYSLSADAVPLNVIELNDVAAVKSLVIVRSVTFAGKTRSSPALGAVSADQFAAVVMLLSPAPPSQVRVAAKALPPVMAKTEETLSKSAARNSFHFFIFLSFFSLF